MPCVARQPGVGDERRQMHGKHGDVEAAHEVAPEQQMEPRSRIASRSAAPSDCPAATATGRPGAPRRAA